MSGVSEGPLRISPSGQEFRGEVDGDILVWDAAAELWKTAPAPVSGVTSVFGRTGAVVAQPGDYVASQVTNDSGVAGATVQAALDALNGKVTYPAPGGGYLRVPSGGGSPEQVQGTAAGQLAFWKSSSGLWLPTPTAPSDQQCPVWNAAAQEWRFASFGASGLNYFPKLSSTVGLWNLDRTLADQSGNGFNLTVLNPYGFAQIVPGRYGLIFDINVTISQAAAGTALGITGDVTTEIIFQLDNNVPAANQNLFSYSASGETLATNTLYQTTLANFGLTPRSIGWLSEHDAGVNDSYNTPTTVGGDSVSLIHNVIYIASVRRANVIQIYMNGKPFGPPSAALTPPNGGTSSKLYIMSSPTQAAQVGGILFAARVSSEGFTASQVLDSYNQSMGPAFGILT